MSKSNVEVVTEALDSLYDDLIAAGHYTGEGCWFVDGEEAEIKARYDQANAAIVDLIAKDRQREAEILDVLKSARLWHLGDKWRDDPSFHNAWKQQFEVLNSMIARLES